MPCEYFERYVSEFRTLIKESLAVKLLTFAETAARLEVRASTVQWLVAYRPAAGRAQGRLPLGA